MNRHNQKYLISGMPRAVRGEHHTAIGYFMQVDPTSAPFSGYIQSDSYTVGIQDEDSFYYADQGRYVGCGKNFVVMLSDGQPYRDGGVPQVPDSNGNGNELDELALWAHRESQDLRTNNGLDGNQNLDIYIVYAFGQGGPLMMEAAKNGGFVDKDDDGQPDGDMIAGNGDVGNEFDENDDDIIIKFAVDAETGDTEVERYADADADGKADSTTPYESVPLDELNPGWESGEKLALRDPATRIIKTWIDLDGNEKVGPGEYIDFDIPNARTLRPFLGAADTTEAEKIISFIRGENVTGYRDRRITIGGTEHVWKLGDIVYSTPTVVGKPMELYHQYYSDHTYAPFYSKWKERGVTVYVGANDGMLHSFKAGTFHEGDNPGTAGKEEHGWYSSTEVPATSEGLGDERWAYIPHNLLPHLKWLTYPNYSHVYYVDLKPKVTDVRIFSDDANHPNGWGTILIGGMRLGGGAFPLTDDFDNNPGTPDENRVFRSAYFVMDITVPNQPVLLGEFTDANLGFTTSYPAISRLEGNKGFQSPDDDEWFFAVGSGPTDYDGNSTQNGYLFVVDLQTMDLEQATVTGESNAFMATPITIDLNLNYNTDVLYIGETYDDAGTWKGKMYRTSMRIDSDPLLFSYREDPSLQPWLMTTLINCDTAPNITPITASAIASMDDDENIWVYFGSGRYYNNSDQSDTTSQYFYGIKDDCAYGDCSPADEVALADLYDASAITVLTNKEVIGAAATTWDTFVDEVQVEDGWFITLDGAGERVLNRPSVLGGLIIFPTFIPDLDICNFGGSGEFYALYYETGTAFYEEVMGTEIYGSEEKSLRSVALGKGVTSIVGLHVGGKTSATGFIQQSTGAVKVVEVTPALSIRPGIIGWMQY